MSSNALGGLTLIVIAGLIAWAWYAGLLTAAINGMIAAFGTAPARRSTVTILGIPIAVPGAGASSTTQPGTPGISA